MFASFEESYLVTALASSLSPLPLAHKSANLSDRRCTSEHSCIISAFSRPCSPSAIYKSIKKRFMLSCKLNRL